MKKNNIDLALAVAAVWLSVSLAVIAGIYFTRDMRCLWFLLIAACVRIVQIVIDQLCMMKIVFGNISFVLTVEQI